MSHGTHLHVVRAIDIIHYELAVLLHLKGEDTLDFGLKGRAVDILEYHHFSRFTYYF